MNFMTSPIAGMMIQFDELIFFRGIGIPPTSTSDIVQGQSSTSFLYLYHTILSGNLT